MALSVFTVLRLSDLPTPILEILMTSRSLIALSLLCLLLAPSVSVRAEDDSAVRDLVSRIKDHLERMRDSLSGLPDDSSQSAVDRIRTALEAARQLRSVAKELADKHPESEPGKTMAERYGDYAERFVSAGEALRELKRLHNNQSNSGLTRRCEEAENKVKEHAQRYVEHKDPEGVERLPALAEQLGGPLARELEDDERRGSEMSNFKSRARDFSESHERWSDVRDRLRDAAEAIYDRYTRTLSEEHRACDEVAKQRQNREVVRALEQLSQSGEVRGQLLRDLDATLDRINEKVANLKERSSDSEITGAVEMTDTVSDILSKLQNAKGKDTKANNIAERWPGYVSEYRDSVRSLRHLKKYQRTLDRAPERCKQETDELRSALARSSEGAGREAKRMAKQLAGDIKDRLDRADRAKSEVQSTRDEARRFSRDEGKWKDVSRAMRDSADSIFAYWENALQKAHEACDDLTRGLDSRIMADGVSNGMFYNQEPDDRTISDCTQNEERPQQDNVIAKCKGSGKKNCNALRTPDDCKEMQYRIDEARICNIARRSIIENCFKNNKHKGHDEQIDQNETLMENCEKKKKQCP